MALFVLASARQLVEMGYELYATPSTAEHLARRSVPATIVPMPVDPDRQSEVHVPSVVDVSSL